MRLAAATAVVALAAGLAACSSEGTEDPKSPGPAASDIRWYESTGSEQLRLAGVALDNYDSALKAGGSPATSLDDACFTLSGTASDLQAAAMPTGRDVARQWKLLLFQVGTAAQQCSAKAYAKGGEYVSAAQDSTSIIRDQFTQGG